MKMFKKIWLVAALVMAFATTAWADSAYTVVNSSYNVGKVGTITSSGTVNSTALASPGTLTGAPAVHWFSDASGNSRVLVFKYLYPTDPSPSVVIYNPATTPWTQVATADWTGITNLYGIATSGSYLYAIDYDNAKIVKVNMTNNAYSLAATYTYPGTTGYEKHGMAIAAVGSYVYGLFMEADNPNATNPTYLASKVVKLNKDTLASVSTAQVGKNAFALKYYNNNLYVPCIGGKQQNGSYNSGQSQLNVVNLANMTVTTPFTAGTAIPYDFRDITLSSTGNAYILVGKYNTDWTMNWRVYNTTATNIASGNIGAIKESNTSTAGYFWALHYENAADRLWFAKGNQVDLRVGSTYVAVKLNMYGSSILGSSAYPNVNSLTILGQSGYTLQGYQDATLSAAQSAGTAAAKKVQDTTK